MKKRNFIIVASGVVIITSSLVFFLPQYLMRAATEKPKELGTMITQPIQVANLNQRLQSSVQKEQMIRQPNHVPSLQSSATPQGNQVKTQVREIETGISLPENKQKQRPVTSPEAPISSQNQRTESAHNTVTEKPILKDIPATESVPQTPNQTFKLSISENELAGMVYNGMYQGIDPRYKKALKGVSVKIKAGVAKFNVALLPKHLPKSYLRSLPGITSESPPIYLGGEVGLIFNKQNIQPKIYNVSLGNLKIPLPMIKSMIKAQFNHYLRQMTQLNSQQRAVLDSVLLNQGRMSITGKIISQP